MIRLRYAPSPTGDPHLGNIRTAIWSWLYAKKKHGKFIVRIEDTDQSRMVPGSVNRILKSLEYLGIDWDEGPQKEGDYGPYVQSERLHIYKEHIDILLKSGNAYKAFETPEELTAIREDQKKHGLPPGYDGRGRNLSDSEIEKNIQINKPYVIRFKMPREGETSFNDVIRGKITVQNKTLDDFILMKSDGFPTYHFAHIVDDHLMKITHVTRGEEWIPSTPKHIAVINALNWEQPIYVHTSIILGPDGGKLSKRHGARSVIEYQEDGYLPQAVLNYLAMTGWALDDKTNIISLDELKNHFEIDQLLPNPATFDENKLNWLNGIYLRKMEPDELSKILQIQLQKDFPQVNIELSLLEKITPIIQERISKTTEISGIASFFFGDNYIFPDEKLFNQHLIEKSNELSATIIKASIELFDNVSQDRWNIEVIENSLRELANKNTIKPGKLFMLLRIIVTGQKISPPLFETIQIVGKNIIIKRLQIALQKLS
jgi:glutamyl-tRNA synthetase|tara:strand:- start:977 stop:2437 length:1461 start_codon:yes stop_codon:yes gene_type:complete